MAVLVPAPPAIPTRTRWPGYVGALLIGLAVGVTAVPLCWLDRVRAPPPDRVPGRLVPGENRRGGWVGLFFAGDRDPAAGRRLPAGRSSCFSRPSSWSPSSRSPPSEADGRARARAARGARYDAVHQQHPPRRPSSRAVRRPQGPSRRHGLQDARDEIIDLSHRIHANPEPAFEERRHRHGSRKSSRAYGYTVEQPVGSLDTAVRGRLDRRARCRRARGSGSWPSTTPCPAWATAAATTRWRHPGSAPRSRLPPFAIRGPARSCSSARPRGGAGSGKAIMIREGVFEGLDAALLYHPCDRDHVEMRAAHLGGRPLSRSRASVPTPPPTRGTRGNALDPLIALFVSVGLWRQQLQTHSGSAGSSRRAARPRTSSRTGHAPGSCSAAPGRTSTRS